MELREYQKRAVDDLRAGLDGGDRRICLQLPTGGGKTRIAAEIAGVEYDDKRRVVFTVPAISLVDQTAQAFYNEGIKEIGIMQADHRDTDPSKPIQIASVQTLMRRGIPVCDFVIQDECHVMFNWMNKWLAMTEWRDTPFVGLSATPWTKGLGKNYQKLIVGARTQQLIDEKVLSPFRVFAPSHPDLTGVRTLAGDYQEDDLSKVMGNEKLVGDIIETWKQLGGDRPTICFAVDCNHADTLRKRFEAAGVPAAYMDAKTPVIEREIIRRKLETGVVKVVCNVEVIGLGVDWPFVSCISYCRPTKSEIRFVQNIGRGLRIHPGKVDCLILDHSDTHMRLGFVTDIHHEQLHDGVARLTPPANPRLPKPCPKCAYLRPFGQRTCPNCGFTVDPPPAVREFTGSGLTEWYGKESSKKREMTEQQKEWFYQELLAYARNRGFKEGWAYYSFIDRFGYKPPRHWRWSRTALTISAATMGWIKSRNIARAKARANQDDRREVMPSSSAAPAQPQETGPVFIPGTLMTEQDLADAADFK